MASASDQAAEDHYTPTPDPPPLPADLAVLHATECVPLNVDVISFTHDLISRLRRRR